MSSVLDGGNKVVASAPAKRARKVYNGREHGEIAIPLEELFIHGRLDFYSDVVAKGYFQIHLRNSELVFQAGAFVGLIPINDRVAIDVEARVPLGNLERVLNIGQHSPVVLKLYFKEYGTSQEQFPSLVDVFVSQMLLVLEQMRMEGIYKEYVSVRHTSANPRGRLLPFESEMLRRRFNRPIAASSSFDRKVDNDPNRCIKLALWILCDAIMRARLKAGARKALHSLNVAYMRFEGVALDHGRRFLAHPIVRTPARLSSFRPAHAQALGLSKAILEGRGPQIRGGGAELALPSLLVNMEKAFEKYARAVLRAALEGRATCRVLDGNFRGEDGGACTLYEDRGEEGQPLATPDLIVTDAGRTSCVAVGDVKYKPITADPDRSDVNQLTTYAARFATNFAFFVMPMSRDLVERHRFVGRIGVFGIHIFFINLGATDLVAEELAFGEAVAHALDV